MPAKETASIQGTADAELTPEQIMNIGKTLGMQYSWVTVGRNMHPSSTMVMSSLIAGLTCTGANVRDAGVLPSPAISFAAENTDCCVMIGNPEDPDRVSGLSFMNRDGRYFNGTQMFAFKSRLDGTKVLSDYQHVGHVKPYNGAAAQYAKRVANFIGVADCQVIVDCASSSSSAAVGEIMKRIDADAMIVSCQTDMRQRGSWSAPEEGNMSSLRKIVTANYGSIGVALNSDGTRLTGIDEHGDVISGDALLQIFVKYLQPRKMTVPIDTTIAVKELIKGKVDYCGLAPENIGETVKMDDLEMGGSGYGSFVFSDISYATDGIAAAALLTKIASDYSLRDMTKDFPVYHRREDSVRYTSNREIIARNINSRISELDYSELFVTDGWRVEMESGWFLIRFSDDSTDIDIKVEGVDKMYSAGLLEIARDIVVSSVKAAQ